MAFRIRKWPTKSQAVVMGIIMLLWLASNWVSVAYEGRAATGFYWAVQSLNVVLLAVSVWLYARVAKHSSKSTP
jgi:hypothetical protein